MKVTEHIQKAKGETLFSIEILPPLRGQDINSIFDNINPLMNYNPAFIDVTYHREEVVYQELPSGLLKKRTIRKRPSTIAISAAIQNRYNIDTVPHIIAGGFTKDETENALIELDFLGIENVLALRGDAAPGQIYFKAEEDGHAYADELVKQVSDLNKGKYLVEDSKHNNPTNFCIGVAGYPEKHFEAANLEQDMKYLKQKVDAGADYIVTQMFFDNQKYFDFVDKCRGMGINVPVVPGLKPFSTKSQLKLLPHRFHLDLPTDLVKAVSEAKDNNAVRQIGVEWAIQQSIELKEAGVPILHYYTMGKSDNIEKIAKAVF
jgi:methylenetetrahydrofolate reductase (NADPH)